MIVLAFVGLLLAAPARVTAATGTLDIRVNHADDTHEERVSTGATDWHSSDLELGEESGNPQIVGIRFQSVSIPQGAIITNAFIDFTTDETDSGTTNLSIWGEDHDNAARFTDVAGQMATRTKTSASVAWNNVPAWGVVGETGVKQQTPDLKTIVQEIVNRPGWVGNAMVFLITGSGERTAESHYGSAEKAPLLHVEYTTESVGDGGGGGDGGVESTGIVISGALDDAREAACVGCDNGEDAIYVRLYRKMLRLPDDASEPIGLRFQNINIPKGTIITNAYLEFTAYDADGGVSEFVITGQAADNPPAFDDAIDNITGRPRTGQSVDWTTTSDTWVVDQKYQSPDISAIIQEIVGRSGWTAGNSLVLIVDSPTEKNDREVFSYDGAWDDPADNGKEPKLYIEFGNETAGDMDTDGDGVLDSADNCPLDFNPEQDDSDGNGQGDICDMGLPDSDGDGIDDLIDNCIDVQNPGQADADGDNIGDACDTAPYITLSRETIGNSCYEGESANHATFTLTNSGAATLNYQMSVEYNVGSGWFSLDPVSATGSLAAGGIQNYIVNFSTTSLPIGVYDAKITFTDPTGAAPNSPQEIMVSLTVFTLPDEDQMISGTCGHVPVYVDNMVTPAILILLDVSSSMSSDTDVTEGEPPRTPNVNSIVQEIVKRPGWQAGNAMVFIIQGTGDREAQSYDNSTGSSPSLHVEYKDAGLPYVKSFRVDQSSDDANERASDGAVLLGQNTLFMMDNSVYSHTGIRFRNVTIPRDANIVNAWLTFMTAASKTTTTSLTIWGQDYDNAPTFAAAQNNISNRVKTQVNVSWSPDVWEGITQEKRVNVGRDVIAELVKDRSIAWGFGSWCEKKEWRYGADGSTSEYDRDYTLILAGTKPNTDEHQVDLQRAIFEQTHIGGTPFLESIVAARKYFAGEKKEWLYTRNAGGEILDISGNVLLSINGDEVDRDGQGAGAETGDVHEPIYCQPKFLIDITDGRGGNPTDDWHTLNPGYDLGDVDAATYKATVDLADSGVTPIAVGFDLPEEDAGMIYAMAKAANEKGAADPEDHLYALHREIDGVPQPFFAYNKQELIDSLKSIAASVKSAVFTGSAPAPTTSVDLGDTLIVAEFDPGFWIGDLKALTKIDPNGGWTTDNMQTSWQASGLMPTKDARNVWTIDPADSSQVVPYTDATLTGDNWLCKLWGIGDIINSTPVVVGTPPYFYTFDNYSQFKYDIIANNKRPALIYVGANDGVLHAWSLDDYTPAVGDPITAGQEVWGFVPKSLQAKLNQAASDPTDDMCADEYCHQYLLDGSPKVADIAHDFDGNKKISADEWRTIMVTGLRSGGQAYFALDVTSGQDFSASNSDPA
ncbi:MAG: thrombospondin type 3 repeat-containing protein, partial [Deltaproteobacteria bacterium]|nr:thrombospondin type 3 repeat-containing protein [Deltaproteobacteria bacterium]